MGYVILITIYYQMATMPNGILHLTFKNNLFIDKIIKNENLDMKLYLVVRNWKEMEMGCPNNGIYIFFNFLKKLYVISKICIHHFLNIIYKNQL